jgi:hypothetical protein
MRQNIRFRAQKARPSGVNWAPAIQNDHLLLAGISRVLEWLTQDLGCGNIFFGNFGKKSQKSILGILTGWIFFGAKHRRKAVFLQWKWKNFLLNMSAVLFAVLHLTYPEIFSQFVAAVLKCMLPLSWIDPSIDGLSDWKSFRQNASRKRKPEGGIPRRQ